MITATYESWERRGFQKLNKGQGWIPGSDFKKPKSEWDGNYLGWLRDGIQIIAEKVRDEVYAPIRAKIKSKFYNAKELEVLCQGTETIDGLITVLTNPKRWTGITEHTRVLLYQIAHSKSEEDAEPWIDVYLKDVKKCKDPVIKRFLEIEGEGAIHAMLTRDTSRYEFN